MQPISTPHSRRTWFWGASLALLALTLAWDRSGLDLPSMHWLATTDGFPLRHQWLLERVLHDAMRHLATALHLGLMLMVVWPLGRMRDLSQWERLSVAVGVTLALLAVNWVKRHSATSCPWELTDFGGVAQYVSHWNWGVLDGGGGHCFPGGHASAALAFLAVPLPWLSASQPGARAFGQKLLVAVVGLGVLLGLTQTLRGAHYPSHTLWTAVLCWGLAVLNHECFARLAQRHARQRATVSVAA
ncbi:MAG TPA: phosphatase PAP2 family protein [Macromonas sp.]|nr:phosphatase PAP2 family protein [Macromonas sp.]